MRACTAHDAGVWMTPKPQNPVRKRKFVKGWAVWIFSVEKYDRSELISYSRSGLIVLHALFAEVKYARLAAIAWAHSRLELGIVVHTAVSFVITHAHPRLLDILVKLKFMLRMHSHSDFRRAVDIRDVLLNTRHDCISDHLGICVLDDGFLNSRSSDSYGLTLFCRLTRTHEYFKLLRNY